MVLSHEAHIKITIGLAVGFVLTIITAVWYISGFVHNTDNSINNISVDVEANTEDIKLLTKEVHEIEVTNAEIRTKLANIETRTAEILTILKDK